MNYLKNKNKNLFSQLEELLNVTKIQNYIPLYNRFFHLNQSNWNSINLNHSSLTNLIQKDDIFMNDKPIFFKFSPLLDPLKYLTGSYEEYDYNLPTLTSNPLPKLGDVNNSSYVDGFFYYLSNLLLDKGFIHGTQFFGSYLAIKENFSYNLCEEIEQVQDSDFFHKNRGTLFTLNKEIQFSDSRKFKDRVVFSDEPVELLLDSLDDEISCSSKESFMEDVKAIIQKFPVQIIAMEKCIDTMDSLLDEMNTTELTAALMQIIMTLITYQQVYSFVHNDLHTNNIMYVNTDQDFLYYCYQGIHYKVPTYGKLYKIIDYGRAIYTYQGRRFVSDSFHEEGDAATQYNMEPFFNMNEPAIDANPSFDLCRLACSILEGFSEEEEIFKVLEEWTQDDKGDSVLFTSEGEERYPDFELYRMITRTVHNHTPIAQLSRPIFTVFKCDPHPCMNIDLFLKE
jgi:hypothetical protein